MRLERIMPPKAFSTDEMRRLSELLRSDTEQQGAARTGMIYIAHHLRVAAYEIDELRRRLDEFGDKGP
jgi:hypothetical protein